MKEYKLYVDGVEHKFRGFTQQVKEDFTDWVKAEKLADIHRLAKKELIDLNQFNQAQESILNIGFISQTTVDIMMKPDGMKKALELLYIPPVGKKPLSYDWMLDKIRDSTSELFVLFKQICEESLAPKTVSHTSETTENTVIS